MAAREPPFLRDGGVMTTPGRPSPMEDGAPAARREGARVVAAPGRATLLASFGHAGRGLVAVAARERNMKLHLLAGITACLAGSELPLPLAGRLALVVCVALVIAAEALNSALEALVDLHTRERRPEARLVKDAAAGAVLALAVGSAAVGALLLATAWAGLAPAARPALTAIAGDVGVVGAAAALLVPGRRGRLVEAALVACGAVLLGAVALRSVSPPLTAVSAALFALSVGTRRYARSAP